MSSSLMRTCVTGEGLCSAAGTGGGGTTAGAGAGTTRATIGAADAARGAGLIGVSCRAARFGDDEYINATRGKTATTISVANQTAKRVDAFAGVRTPSATRTPIAMTTLKMMHCASTVQTSSVNAVKMSMLFAFFNKLLQPAQILLTELLVFDKVGNKQPR